MKRFIVFFLVFALSLGVGVSTVHADDTTKTTQTTGQPTTTTPANEEKKPEAAATTTEEVSMHQEIKRYFIEGGWQFMMIILIPLILGLAISIERVITLSLASINTEKFLNSIEEQIKAGNIEAAREICLTTAGPTAEVLGEGLKRVNEGVDLVEKTIVSNGSVQTGLLEKGLVWLALFIALAPMLGFMGTVIGMIQAFDSIEKAGDIRPSDVAGGIKVALLTTVFGLIAAMILQFFYNLITSKIEALVNTMEDSTIAVIDMLIDNGYADKKSA
jgi:biopolymer transport protein ExbB